MPDPAPVPAPVPTLAERLQQRIEKSCEANRFCLEFFLFAHAHEAGEDGIKAAIQTAFENVAKETRELLAELTPEPVRPTPCEKHDEAFIGLCPLCGWNIGAVVHSRFVKSRQLTQPVSAPPTPREQHLMAENARLEALANDRGNEVVRLQAVLSENSSPAEELYAALDEAAPMQKPRRIFPKLKLGKCSICGTVTHINPTSGRLRPHYPDGLKRASDCTNARALPLPESQHEPETDR